MTARILTCYTPPVVALADKLLEALLPISVTLGMVTFGIATDVEAIVTSRIMVVVTHLPQALVRCIVVAIFKANITCPSGVTGAVVTDPWWWLEEEAMAATGRIMGLVSQRLILLSLVQAIAMETLEITAAILAVILSICGLSSFV